MSLARSGGLLIYVNILNSLREVVRRTKMLDFLAVRGYTDRFPANIKGWTPHEDDVSRLFFDWHHRYSRQRDRSGRTRAVQAGRRQNVRSLRRHVVEQPGALWRNARRP